MASEKHTNKVPLATFITVRNGSLKRKAEKDYKDVSEGRSLPDMPRSLKPYKNLVTGEIEITTPDGKKEYYKESRGLTGSRFKKIR